MEIKSEIKKAFDRASDKIGFINGIKEILYSFSPEKCNPVDRVIWVPKEKVVANDYNPNHVAPKELALLHTSIKEDGYTQPIVTVYDKERELFVIIDGFHRNLVLRKYADIEDRNKGYLPIVVLEKNIDQRMASTVRHNRARGSHSVDGMANIIYSMMNDGLPESEICAKLGLEEREFTKLKYITGFAKIFKDYDYSKSVEKVLDVYNNKKQ